MPHLFTFGTLTNADILTALLGRVPPVQDAVLQDWAVFEFDTSALSPELRQDFVSKGHDMTQFRFLAAQPCPGQSINGRLLALTSGQTELVDAWERCPAWYQKANVKVTTKESPQIDALIYTYSGQGILKDHFDPVPYDLSLLVKNARNLRAQFQTHKSA